MITYWLRRGCSWVRVRTSRAIWKRLPHVTLGTGCAAGAILAGGLLGVIPHRPVAPPQAPHEGGQVVPGSVGQGIGPTGSGFWYPPQAVPNDWPPGVPGLPVGRGDHASFTPPYQPPQDVPEPSTLELMAVGLVLVAGVKARRVLS